MDDIKKIDGVDPETIKVLNAEFPPNSHKKKDIASPISEKKVGKVVTGLVVQKKKPWFKRITGTFFDDSTTNVSQYILNDVIIPATKDTIAAMVKGGIEMLLFGEVKGNRTRREGTRSYVNYSGYSSGRPAREERTPAASRDRARQNFDDIVLESRGEAETVLSNLVDLTVDYGQATVGDLYDLVGITAVFTDNSWGWTSLSTATVSRVRDGYMLDLPKPIALGR